MKKIAVVAVGVCLLGLAIVCDPTVQASPQPVRAKYVSSMRAVRMTTDDYSTTTAPTTTTTAEVTTSTQPSSGFRKKQMETTTTEQAQPDPQPVDSTPATDPARAAWDGSVEGAINAWFPQNSGSARRVSGCESGHDPNAVSPGGGNYGLFQINNTHSAEFANVTGVSFHSEWSDAWYNAKYAKALYDESGGWGPWSCRWAA